MAEDELEPLITRCPNCDTRFRVNEAQLQAAVGKVRCGACLNVFDGTDYLLLDGELLPADAEDVDVLLSEIDAQEQHLVEEPDDFGFAPAPAEEQIPPLTEIDDRFESGEVELAELEAQLLAELKGETSVAAVIQQDHVQPDAESADDDFDALLRANEQSIEGQTPTVEASPTSEVSPHQEAHPQEVLLQEEAEGSDDAEEDVLPAATAATDAGSKNTQLDAEAEALDDAPWMEPEAVPNSSTANAEPSLFESALLYEEPAPKRSWLSWLLIVVALIGLPAQVFWFQFDEWSKVPSLRPIYAQACGVLQCELPVRRDIDAITARNSVLRDHPEVADALVYDALLLNQAPYEQPYPLVELTLTTIGGQLVASRRFTPTEYLSGEVSSQDLMASFTPVHISIAIKDPGEAPLNFKVRFLPLL